jgi:DMSO/TMAO reductase YedYZ molybdopterin-dependent catalytic subunit
LALGTIGVVSVGLLRRVGRQVAAGIVRIDRRAIRSHNPEFDRVAGLSPVVTSRADHYTVDIDLLDPGVDDGSWRLNVGGAVDNLLSLSLDELRALPTIERHATLSCISNPVGGELVGSSLWVGVPLAELLRRAGTSSSAITVEALAVDGYSDSIPMGVAVDPDTFVAFGMNGSLLPRGHGFPARLRVPSRYGIKNVKWLRGLTVRTTEVAGYWGIRGWDGVAVVKTESRIDVPQGGATVARRITMAGVAWAGSRRVTAVEVSTDDGRTWRPARLDREGDPVAWRRWQADIELGPGEHTLAVRATDGAGVVQIAERRPPHPSGASGYHQVRVNTR